MLDAEDAKDAEEDNRGSVCGHLHCLNSHLHGKKSASQAELTLQCPRMHADFVCTTCETKGYDRCHLANCRAHIQFPDTTTTPSSNHARPRVFTIIYWAIINNP